MFQIIYHINSLILCVCVCVSAVFRCFHIEKSPSRPVSFAQWFSWGGGFLLSLISRLNSLWKCPNEHFGLLFRTPHTQEIDGLTLPGRPSTLIGCRPRIDAVLSPVFSYDLRSTHSTREAKIRSFCIQTLSLEPWKSRHFGLLSRPGPCRSESVLCLACSQCWRPSWRHCSWERCQSDIHSKMLAPRCFRLRMWEWLSL